MASADHPTVEGVDLEAMREALAESVVVFAVLFGSRARGPSTDTAESDVDIALRFPDEMDASERFHTRNRIDADLQAYADGFVDVSDIDSLPIPVAHAALQDGILLVGDEPTVHAYRSRVTRAYEATADERERERRAFIDRLARGDT